MAVVFQLEICSDGNEMRQHMPRVNVSIDTIGSH